MGQVLEEDERDVEAHHAKQIRKTQDDHHRIAQQFQVDHLREGGTNRQRNALALATIDELILF